MPLAPLHGTTLTMRSPKRVPVRVNSFWESGLVLSLTFASVTPTIPMAVKAGMMGVIAMFFAVWMGKRSTISPYLIALFGLIFAVSITVDLFVNSEYREWITLSSFYIPFCVVLAIIIASRLTFEIFLSKFERVFFPLACLSLALFIIGMARPDVIYTFPTYEFGDLTHRTLFFQNFLFADGFLIQRHSGFASEPGVYQILLNLALFQNLRRGRSLSVRNAVYVISVFLGLSTVGMIIASILLAFYANNWGRIGVLLACGIFAATVQAVVDDQIESKLQGSYAFNQRYEPLENAFRFFLSNPAGVGSAAYTLELERENIGSFDSYSQIGMRYGLQGILLFLFCLWRLFRYSAGVALILSLSFATNSFWYIPIFACFLFWSRSCGTPEGRRDGASG